MQPERIEELEKSYARDSMQHKPMTTIEVRHLLRAAREREELRDELRRTRHNLGELEEVSVQWMQAARSERARAEKAEARAKELEAALAVAILGSDYSDRCHSGPFAPSRHVATPPEFVRWARARLGEQYDPTCQEPVMRAICAPLAQKEPR